MNRIKNWLDSLPTTWRSILTGQFISILIAGTGVFATILSNSEPNANFPLLLNMGNYFLLSFFLIKKDTINNILYYFNSKSNNNIDNNITMNVIHNGNIKNNIIIEKNDEESLSNCLLDPSSPYSNNNSPNTSPILSSNQSNNSSSLRQNSFSEPIIETETSSSFLSFFLNYGNLEDGKDYNKLVYFFAAILDVEANFCVLLAYNYTTITSVMLLDCFSIPCVVILSTFFLGYKYSKIHFFAIMLCLIGFLFIVLNDANVFEGNNGSSDGDDEVPNDQDPTDPPVVSSSLSISFTSYIISSISSFFSTSSFVSTSYPSRRLSSGMSKAILGDILCLCSAFLYACSNTLQEKMIKNNKRKEFLGNLGRFGCVISFVQCMIVDYHRISEASVGIVQILSMIGFIICLFGMYTTTSFFLENNDATLLNLSLLTSDVYAIIFSYFFYNTFINIYYFIAFSFVFAGLYLYHKQETPSALGQLNNEDILKIKMNSTSIDDVENSNNKLVESNE